MAAEITNPKRGSLERLNHLFRMPKPH